MFVDWPLSAVKSSKGWVTVCRMLEFSPDLPQVMMICWKNAYLYAFTTPGKLRKLELERTAAEPLHLLLRLCHNGILT
jgi:hypothetical protein